MDRKSQPSWENISNYFSYAGYLLSLDVVLLLQQLVFFTWEFLGVEDSVNVLKLWVGHILYSGQSISAPSFGPYAIG